MSDAGVRDMGDRFVLIPQETVAATCAAAVLPISHLGASLLEQRRG